MELAKIDPSAPEPAGGRVIKDSLGAPIGVFQETAETLITNVYQKFLDGLSKINKDEKIRREIKFAVDECLSKGITSFYDAGSTFEEVDVYKNLTDEEKLGVRLNVMLYETNERLKKKIKDYKIIGYGNDHLTVRAIKKYIDGALGSRGAWMLEPYDDMPESSGQNITPIDELIETSDIAIKNGFQLCTHAIGDRGNREVMNIYEFTFDKNPDFKDCRWRIEHAQHLSKNDIPRFGKLGVIASMQGIHCTSDATFVPRRIGEKRAKEGAYVWRKLIDSGALICNGTDSPVEDINPINCFYSSVTRKAKNGKTFYPDQKMSRMEALKSYTINGAYAAFQENILGSITKGKLADIVVLSNDLLNCPEDQIKKTKVLFTIIGGKIMYKAEGK
ncbi:MAG: amidohydrolase [bacterium]